VQLFQNEFRKKREKSGGARDDYRQENDSIANLFNSSA
jgi:hypothetical protein